MTDNKAKNILAIDTAMNGVGVGLQTGNGDFFEDQAIMVRGQAEQLMPMVVKVMTRAKLEPKALDALCVTIGPGTFTGLRLGLSVAKTLSLSLKIPAYGLTTVSILGYQTRDQGKHAIVLETKRKDFYIQGFEGEHSLFEAQALEIDKCEELLGAHQIKKIIGDAGGRFQTLAQGNFETEEINMPSTKAMIEMVSMSRFQNTDLSPVYLRGADVSKSKKKIRKIAT